QYQHSCKQRHQMPGPHACVLIVRRVSSVYAKDNSGAAGENASFGEKAGITIGCDAGREG
ncbi:hypothetical protein, partial [Klebsiella pneumoniae]